MSPCILTDLYEYKGAPTQSQILSPAFHGLFLNFNFFLLFESGFQVNAFWMQLLWYELLSLWRDISGGGESVFQVYLSTAIYFPRKGLSSNVISGSRCCPSFVLKVSVEGLAQRTQPQGCPGGLGLMPDSTCLLCSITAGGWYLVQGLSHELWEQAYKCQFLGGHLAHGGARRGHHLGLYRMLPKWLWESSWLHEYQLWESS